MGLDKLSSSAGKNAAAACQSQQLSELEEEARSGSEAEERMILQLLSPMDESNAFSLVGKYACKRRILTKKYEDQLQEHMSKMRVKIERRLNKY